MGCGASRQIAPHTSELRPRARSVCVFWDVENCAVPSGVSASDVVSALRKWLASLGWPSEPPDMHMVAAYNVFANRASPALWKSLKHAGVEQVAAGPKHESADRELELRMRRELRLLPQGEQVTCIVLVTSDMDFLSFVRDELRGRVRVQWIYSDEVHLSAATLRQLEEATRPSWMAEARAPTSLPTWEHVLTFGTATGATGAGGAASNDAADGDNASDGDRGSQQRSRGRSRSRNRGATDGGNPARQGGGSASGGGGGGRRAHKDRSERVASGASASASHSTSPTPPSPPLQAPLPQPAPGRLMGRVVHWKGGSDKRTMWGYVMVDGDDATKRHFRLNDVLGPVPAKISLGSPVEFTPDVNPPGGKYAGKAIATQVSFIM